MSQCAEQCEDKTMAALTPARVYRRLLTAVRVAVAYPGPRKRLCQNIRDAFEIRGAMVMDEAGVLRCLNEVSECARQLSAQWIAEVGQCAHSIEQRMYSV
jgi:hypothetical protein